MQKLKPAFLFFVFITAFSITAKGWFAAKGISQWVVLGGNLLLFLVTLITFFITTRSYRSGNPQAPVRAMYGSFMIKFFVLAIAAFVYILLQKKEVNKPALVLCALFYIIYTAIETRALLQLTQKKGNA